MKSKEFARRRKQLMNMVGAEGIGKSALVRHALHGAVWVHADAAATPDALKREALRALRLSGGADLEQLLPLLPPRRPCPPKPRRSPRRRRSRACRRRGGTRPPCRSPRFPRPRSRI